MAEESNTSELLEKLSSNSNSNTKMRLLEARMIGHPSPVETSLTSKGSPTVKDLSTMWDHTAMQGSPARTMDEASTNSDSEEEVSNLRLNATLLGLVVRDAFSSCGRWADWTSLDFYLNFNRLICVNGHVCGQKGFSGSLIDLWIPLVLSIKIEMRSACQGRSCKRMSVIAVSDHLWR